MRAFDDRSFKEVTRRDYFDVMADLPRLPEGAVMSHPHSVLNPIAIDSRTGVYFTLKNNEWVMTD